LFLLLFLLLFRLLFLFLFLREIDLCLAGLLPDLPGSLPAPLTCARQPDRRPELVVVRVGSSSRGRVIVSLCHCRACRPACSARSARSALLLAAGPATEIATAGVIDFPFGRDNCLHSLHSLYCLWRQGKASRAFVSALLLPCSSHRVSPRPLASCPPARQQQQARLCHRSPIALPSPSPRRCSVPRSPLRVSCRSAVACATISCHCAIVPPPVEPLRAY